MSVLKLSLNNVNIKNYRKTCKIHFSKTDHKYIKDLLQVMD